MLSIEFGFYFHPFKNVMEWVYSNEERYGCEHGAVFLMQK